MCVPPVFTASENTVLPSQYEEMIPDGTMVAVRRNQDVSVGFVLYFFELCGLCLNICRYNILSRDRLFVNRPFFFTFN